MPPHPRTVYLGSALHGAWMVTLALLLLANGCATGDELMVVRLASTARHATATAAEQPRPDDVFTFVDVAHDLQLIEKTNEAGFPIGNQAITDREKLARLFRIIKREDVHRFVLCDVFFEDASPADRVLQQAVTGLRDVLFPYHLDDQRHPQPPVVDVPKGLADYTLHGGAFLKFTLMEQDTLASLPLKMHRALHPERRARGWMRLNTFIPDMEIPTDHLGQPVTLGQLLALPDSAMVRAYLEDRIVVIGDFSTDDRHMTALGPMPGALILANTYLALQSGGNHVPTALLLFLWVTFSLLSFWNATRISELRHALPPVSPPWRLRGYQSRLGRLLPILLDGDRDGDVWWNGLCNVLALAAVSGMAYLAFGVHLHVLVLAVYLGVAGTLLRDHFSPERSWWEKIADAAHRPEGERMDKAHARETPTGAAPPLPGRSLTPARAHSEGKNASSAERAPE